jgi:methyl-accepting chemotaxis protein
MSPRGPIRVRLTIGLKLGLLIALLLAVLAASSGVLIAQNRSTAQAYQRLLLREVRQGQLARQLQVEFKKRVQEWKDILLRGSDPAELRVYSANFARQDATVHDLYRQLLAADPDPGLRVQVQKSADLESGVDQAYQQAYTGFLASDGTDFAAADRIVRGIDRPLTDQLDRIVADLEARIAEHVTAQQYLTAQRQRLTLLASVVLVVLLSALLFLALLRIVRPVRDLIRQADRAANEHLPAAVERIKTLRPDDEMPTLPRFRATTSDELADLAQALTLLQESALEQAIAQHRADRETADMLVNLGRRNQNLLGRMLSYVTELERQEEDPDVLAQLFRLDHATTRIRRNAESMLVLAGASQTRTWSRPVPVLDVVRAALSEIEEYGRVDLHHLEDALVNGSAVADVVHLIAELVENATHFSPPTTRVTVVGQQVREGYRLRVVDQGVGMTRRELDEANGRIHRVDGGWADSKLLGLFVVGRLARRRSVGVALEPSAGRGITASILLPSSVLSAATGAGSPASSPGSSETAPGSASVASDPVPVTVPEPTSSEQSRSEQPRPTLPAALGAAGRLGAADEKLTIDLTDSCGARGRDPLAAGTVPVQWFDHRTGRPDGDDRDRDRGGGGGGGGAAIIPAVPRRVRGAQLPDLGPAAEPTIARPDEGPGAAESLRWQLRSFQLDVQAARRAISESEPAADVGGRGGDHDGDPDEQAGPVAGHHHPEGE